jgi:hypothetical protein
MTDQIARQFAALRRIAAFSAELRGHQLGEWHANEDFAVASCVQCGAELRTYFPALQPEMDGPALEHECARRAVSVEAASPAPSMSRAAG